MPADGVRADTFGVRYAIQREGAPADAFVFREGSEAGVSINRLPIAQIGGADWRRGDGGAEDFEQDYPLPRNIRRETVGKGTQIPVRPQIPHGGRTRLKGEITPRARDVRGIGGAVEEGNCACR